MAGYNLRKTAGRSSRVQKGSGSPAVGGKRGTGPLLQPESPLSGDQVSQTAARRTVEQSTSTVRITRRTKTSKPTVRRPHETIESPEASKTAVETPSQKRRKSLAAMEATLQKAYKESNMAPRNGHKVPTGRHEAVHARKPNTVSYETNDEIEDTDKSESIDFANTDELFAYDTNAAIVDINDSDVDDSDQEDYIETTNIFIPISLADTDAMEEAATYARLNLNDATITMYQGRFKERLEGITRHIFQILGNLKSSDSIFSSPFTNSTWVTISPRQNKVDLVINAMEKAVLPAARTILGAPSLTRDGILALSPINSKHLKKGTYLDIVTNDLDETEHALYNGSGTGTAKPTESGVWGRYANHQRYLAAPPGPDESQHYRYIRSGGQRRTNFRLVSIFETAEDTSVSIEDPDWLVILWETVQILMTRSYDVHAHFGKFNNAACVQLFADIADFTIPHSFPRPAEPLNKALPIKQGIKKHIRPTKCSNCGAKLGKSGWSNVPGTLDKIWCAVCYTYYRRNADVRPESMYASPWIGSERVCYTLGCPSLGVLLHHPDPELKGKYLCEKCLYIYQDPPELRVCIDCGSKDMTNRWTKCFGQARKWRCGPCTTKWKVAERERDPPPAKPSKCWHCRKPASKKTRGSLLTWNTECRKWLCENCRSSCSKNSVLPFVRRQTEGIEFRCDTPECQRVKSRWWRLFRDNQDQSVKLYCRQCRFQSAHQSLPNDETFHTWMWLRPGRRRKFRADLLRDYLARYQINNSPEAIRLLSATDNNQIDEQMNIANH
ncbi:uncharacterized protein BO95DRAFT_437415 [Aspergillus brunneoviolaceus CBS 621.78]|uniref:Uncharacterized protein n=1 Tax=Aspergillus brunneoviolaceus CBS 621.78 TaxID=1450534 RepID=A0ACD1FRM7_9EURO|nr:hypothetical protein BO95DRAFT_437415 [Aspergillus brunneoviolaceus CBS 621.78]RAH39626.1 hypothetical protein BO95DRAFT_437415 [Aspergillus brunneoviolaceus CBS 621.78]